MNETPRAGCPFARRLERALELSNEGLTVRELRKVLMGQGFAYLPAEIQAQLQACPDTFVRGDDGVWSLVPATPGECALPEDARAPLCATPPDLSRYVAFDVETTGLEPESDRIFQIAAVRVDGEGPMVGPPADDALFSRYAKLEGCELPYSLRVKLGLVDHPEWQQELDEASPLAEVIEEFRRWVGDVPLVAHNAEFDVAFLRSAGERVGWHPENPTLCTLELAMLACPELPRHRLEDLAEHFELGPVVGKWLLEAGLDEALFGTFHNAATDVLYVVALLNSVTNRLRQRIADHGEFRAAAWRLLPELCQRLGLPAESHADSPSTSCADTTARDGAPCPTRIPAELDPDEVSKWFAQQVALHDLKPREAQYEMVRRVSQCLTEGGIAAIEAPTGTGKTFGYLAPCAVAAGSGIRPIFVSTHTRLLQDQLAADLMHLNTLWGLSLSGQILKGLQNYLCRSEFNTLLAQAIGADGLPASGGTLTPQQRYALLCLLSWQATTREGLLEEVSFWLRERFPAAKALCSQLAAEWGRCPEERCPGCYHADAYDRAAGADVVITNHALLLAKEWDEDGLFPTHVVLDEAHKLEDAATDADTDEASRTTILRLLRQLHDRRSGHGLLVRLQSVIATDAERKPVRAAFGRVDRVEQRVSGFAECLQQYCERQGRPFDAAYGAKLRLRASPRRANPTGWEPVETEKRALVELLNSLARELSELRGMLGSSPLREHQDETLRQLQYLEDKLGEEAEKLETILQVGYDPLKRVHWVELESDGTNKAVSWAIKSAPVRVGDLLAERLYDRAHAVVLTSATLGTTRDQGFAFVLDRLGLTERLEADRAISLPHPFDYSRALFAVTRYLSSAARPNEMRQFEEDITDELRRFCEFGEGDALCLFTARRRMERVFEEIRGDLGKSGIAVDAQVPHASRRALLEDFRSRPGSVLLGLKSFWEGVDVPGSNLRYVTMDKLPFPLLDDPIVGARSEEIRARSGHEFVDYILPLMLTDFKQGFGRLIRDENDIGVVLLLDKRVWTKEYFADLTGALPGDRDEHSTVTIPDDDVLLNRRRVYQAIIDHLRGAPREWNLDLDAMRQRLEQMQEGPTRGFARLLTEVSLPSGFDPDAPDVWARVLRAVEEGFGYSGFLSVEQETAVRAVLRGDDVMVILPTSAGKSLAFQLPALLTPGLTVVFSPLKALMKDQVDRLQDLGLRCVDRIDGSQSPEEQEDVFERMRRGDTRLLYISPERIRDPRLRAALRATPDIARVVVDEAHCVHEWGQSFRPDYLHIREIVRDLTKNAERRIPLAALTATAGPPLRASIAKHLGLSQYTEVQRSPDRPELHFVVYNEHTPGVYCIDREDDKLTVLRRILHHADRQAHSAIVYTSTTGEAERLAGKLRTSGLPARCYHGKMDDQARHETQEMFLDGQVGTIVATKAFGMGIDKPDVRYVIHYNLPASVEEYFQEAGRAGRDGKASYCILLYHPADLRVHEDYFIAKAVPDERQLNVLLYGLKKRMGNSGGGPLYVDSRDLSTDTGVEEQQLGLHLHLLERRGAIHRGADITLVASCRLIRPMNEIAARAVALGTSPCVAKAVVRILKRRAIATQRSELRTVDEARTEGVSPREVDDLLYALAQERLVIYRAFARALSIERTDRLDVQPGANRAAVQQEMRDKLDYIRRYAESALDAPCCRRYLLECLGYTEASSSPTPCCSHCNPNDYPWLDEDVTLDLANPEVHQDVEYAVLQAVDWNARREPPYGQNQLTRLLLGDDYVEGSNDEASWQTNVRRRRIAESEYFGRLQGLPRGTARIGEALETLKAAGLVQMHSREAGFGPYPYPALTDAGARHLTRGKHIGQ